MIKFLLFACLSMNAFGVGQLWNGFALTEHLSFEKLPDVQTTDATETVMHSIALPDPSTYLVRANCEARKSDGTKREGFIKTVLAYRSGGAAAIEGSIVNDFSQSGTSYAMTYAVSGNDLQVKVTGAASETVDFRCAIQTQKLE